MSGRGSSTRWKTGVPASLDSLTLNPHATISRPGYSSHGTADIAAHPGPDTADGSGNQPTRFIPTPQSSHPGTSGIIGPVLDNPESFDDPPYVPPRVAAEPQPYSAPHPRASNVYDDIHHQYPFEGGASPADSHHSADSHWTASSSSSASSQHLARDYFVGPTPQFSRNPQSTRHHYYPAYQGQHRHGLEQVRFGEHPSNTGGSYYRTSPQDYSIDSFLSPEIFDDAGSRVNAPPQMNYPATAFHGPSSSSAIPATNQPSVSTFSVSPTPPIEGSRSRFPDAGPYLRQQLGLSPHEAVSLHSLPDPPPGEKPSTPLPMLIKLAIYGSPSRQLTLQEIYTELESRFQWFRDHKNDKAWKNSIRHNLSLNKVFKHVPRPITEPGKGSYWQLDVSEGEGYKRARKRRPKNKMAASEDDDEEISEMDEDRPSPGRSSTTPVDDANIDPGLRGEGHVVGEGRTRSTTRRAGGSPYPSQSPRYQQGPLPVVVGQDANAPGQPPVRFGQPSFGQTSFPAYPQTRQIPAATSSAPFTALSSSTAAMAATTSAPVRRPLQRTASYDRTAQIPQPQLPQRLGIEYVIEPGGLPVARRVITHPEAQEQPQDTAGSSPESSSGSSRTWKDDRSRSGMQG